MAEYFPAGDRVYVEFMKESQNKKGLIIRAERQQMYFRGKVLKVGPGLIDNNGNRIPVDAKVGDWVMFNVYAALPIDYDNLENVKTYMFSAKEIICTMTLTEEDLKPEEPKSNIIIAPAGSI
jgi:co-chaperonin GroES (HSP10)